MSRKRPKFRDALAVLSRHDVEFIVVGGVAAVLHGAPITTFDLDIVHLRTPENIARLCTALAELHAHHRDLTGRHLPPDAQLLASDGHNLFNTDAGPLDVLGTIGSGHRYEELVAQTIERPLAGKSMRVLTLSALIRTKEEVAGEKDRAALTILRRTLDESEGRS
jgi:hypothetical protein